MQIKTAILNSSRPIYVDDINNRNNVQPYHSNTYLKQSWARSFSQNIAAYFKIRKSDYSYYQQKENKDKKPQESILGSYAANTKNEPGVNHLFVCVCLWK